ncbi:MAG: polyprenyl synthetase family protein [Deltaproteobacteria bacterium]|nr:polyprenyl synthetase family protein [Deltaproteobacteria bacterium]
MQLDSILLPIRDELPRVETEILAASATSVPTITEIVHYIIRNGGKRVRPALTMLAGRVCGYTGTAGPRIGAAIEMVHTASLLHDDVVDSAPTRRGKTSINARWGNQISVLVGDFFWCKACQIIVDHGNSRILRVITEAIVGTTEGEVIELVKTNDLGLTEAEYLRIIQHKTALLMAAACRAGAMLGDASEGMEAALGRYGLDLGVAFQLADDALDYDSDEERLGKTKGTDLREGRLTLPLLYTLGRCNESERASIKEALLAPTLHEEQFGAVVQLLAQYDAIAHTRNLAQQYVERAKAHLTPFKPSLERDALERLADYVVLRGE